MTIEALICFLGLALHFAMKWAEARRDNPLSLKQYLALVPAQTAVAVIAAIVSFLVVWQLDWLNPGMSLACGYMGHSVAENLANKFVVLK